MYALSFMCVFISRLFSYSNKLIMRTTKIRFNPMKSSLTNHRHTCNSSLLWKTPAT